MKATDNFVYKVRSDVAKLAPAIIDVMAVAKRHGVKCWLNYGALLGIIREQRLLPWNNDAQVCCWYETNISDKFKRITEELNELGYHAIYYSTIGAVSVRQIGVAVHITCYWQEEDCAVRPHESPGDFGYAPLIASIFYWLATFMGAYPSGLVHYNRLPLSMNELIKLVLVSIFRLIPNVLRKRLFLFLLCCSKLFGGTFQKTAIPMKYFDNFISYEFYGQSIYIPEKSKQLLTFIYGKDWETPKDDWSFYENENKDETGIEFIDTMWNYKDIDIV